MYQLPLNIKLDDSATFANFFAGKHQQLIVRLNQVVMGPPEFFFVWGGEACGKTHLAQALCHDFDLAGKNSVYLPLCNPELTPAVLEGLDFFDLVVLDNLQAVLTSDVWQLGLFNLYNNLKLADKSLVIFANNSPSELLLSLADLKSRLTAMEIYKLDLADDADKLKIFQLRASNRGFEITDEVGNFLLTRKKRCLSELIALLDQIDHSTIRMQRKVTIPLLKQLFNL